MDKNETKKVQCTRCRNKHLKEERVDKPERKWGINNITVSTCPKCGCKSYYANPEDFV